MVGRPLQPESSAPPPALDSAQRSPALSSASPKPAARAGRRWRSAELFGREQEIEIEHGQVVYRLRLTSLGKLILTK